MIGKEGLKILMDKGRIEILPGSVHLLCPLGKFKEFCDWLMNEVLLVNGSTLTAVMTSLNMRELIYSD